MKSLLTATVKMSLDVGWQQRHTAKKIFFRSTKNLLLVEHGDLDRIALSKLSANMLVNHNVDMTILEEIADYYY